MPRASGHPVLLVLRAPGLGELLTAVPALRALQQAFPEHHRLLAAPSVLAPLVHEYDLADEVMHVSGLGRLDGQVPRPEVAVNLHGAAPRSHRMLLGARPQRLVAYRDDAVEESFDGPPWREGEHEVERWCRLLVESFIPADASRLDLPRPAAVVGADIDGATVIHPGAGSRARRWPADRWADVARAEHAAGRRVVITGGGDEVDLARMVATRAGLDDDAVLAGNTDLLQLAGVVAAAGRVVAGDTGVSHLATALGTPSVVLFGPRPPGEWGPPPERTQHRALWAGHRGDPDGQQPDAGLLAISVGEVIDALADLSEDEEMARS